MNIYLYFLYFRRSSVKEAERINFIAEDLISLCFQKENGVFAQKKDALIAVAEVYFSTVHWLKQESLSEVQGDDESLKYSKRIAAYQEFSNLFCKSVKPNPPHRGEVELEKWLRVSLDLSFNM